MGHGMVRGMPKPGLTAGGKRDLNKARVSPNGNRGKVFIGSPAVVGE